MNNARRAELDKAYALISEAQGIIEAVRDEEQDAYDNLGENFQNGERGEKMVAAIDALEEACDACEGIGVSITTAKE